MSGDTMKAREIFLLNILKNNVLEDKVEDYRLGLGVVDKEELKCRKG